MFPSRSWKHSIVWYGLKLSSLSNTSILSRCCVSSLIDWLVCSKKKKKRIAAFGWLRRRSSLHHHPSLFSFVSGEKMKHVSPQARRPQVEVSRCPNQKPSVSFPSDLIFIICDHFIILHSAILSLILLPKAYWTPSPLPFCKINTGEGLLLPYMSVCLVAE